MKDEYFHTSYFILHNLPRRHGDTERKQKEKKMFSDFSKWRVHHLKKSLNTSPGVIPGERGDGTTNNTSPSGGFLLHETVAFILATVFPWTK